MALGFAGFGFRVKMFGPGPLQLNGKLALVDLDLAASPFPGPQVLIYVLRMQDLRSERVLQSRTDILRPDGGSKNEGDLMM